MHSKLNKILAKKRDLSAPEKRAKMDVIKHLRGEASDAMKDHMGHFQKATVMADSPEGLKKGLDKAKEVVSSGAFDKMREDAESSESDATHAREEQPGYADGGEVEEDEESPEHEASESPAEEASEHDEFSGMSHEELQALQEKIQKLLESK
jgi:hypothetical protein